MFLKDPALAHSRSWHILITRLFCKKGIVTSYADSAFSCYTKKSQESPISNKLYPIEPGKIATYKKMSLNSVKMKHRAVGSAFNGNLLSISKIEITLI